MTRASINRKLPLLRPRPHFRRGTKVTTDHSQRTTFIETIAVERKNGMKTGHELFIHGMTDMLDAERQLVTALQELEQDSSNSQLKEAFARHREETQKQVERLQQGFRLLGEEPEESECKGIRGIIEEKKLFMEEDPAPDILDVFHVGAAIKTEAYEICEYESLIEKAREMKHSKVAQLLNQNLREERATLKKMEAFSKKLKPEQMMSEEQEQNARAASGRSRRKRAA
jgi:ferritin-like metal-binding protein YciE